uniref:citrate synthase (unknown stereospecificity) n=1 Tax=uncultured prokaryote TaxID=198431 RepID=H5SEL0_9ZZZZ|nr:citrate synthase [uncultured prokaryote]
MNPHILSVTVKIEVILIKRGRIMQQDEKKLYNSKGLENVIANQTKLCFIDGRRSKLLYLGYDIEDLSQHSTFEEVAFLLWNHYLPNRDEYQRLLMQVRSEYQIPEDLINIMRMFPKDSDPMDVLRSSVSILGLFDPEKDDNSIDANKRKAIRITAKFPTIVATWHQLREGKEPIKPEKDFNIATNFLYMLTGQKPDELTARIMDVCLILHAEHELNASTFSARVTISTLTDIYSAITSAIGTLKGPLHGGANREVMKYLIAIGDISHVDAFIEEAIKKGRKLEGFGHRVYKSIDPRAVVLKRYSKLLGEKTGETKWYEMSARIEELWVSKFGQKGVWPNVDFYSASVYHSMGIPLDLYTPIFAMGRMAGWTAHVIEQLSDNRIYRPRSEYTGPPERAYVPLDQRG